MTLLWRGLGHPLPPLLLAWLVLMLLPVSGAWPLLSALLFLLMVAPRLSGKGWLRVLRRLGLLQATLVLPAGLWRLVWWGWGGQAWLWVADWSIRILLSLVFLELMSALGGERGALRVLETLPGMPTWLLYLVVLVRAFVLNLREAWTEGGRILILRGCSRPWSRPGLWSQWLVRQVHGLLLQARCLEHGLTLRGFSGVYPGPGTAEGPAWDRGQIWLFLLLASVFGRYLDGVLPL